MFLHVFVNVICLDVKEQAVCVCVDQIALRPVSSFQVVVVEVVHQELAGIENSHSCVHWLVQNQTLFVHMDARHVVVKKFEAVILRV